MATTDWKGSLPLTVFLFAVAAMYFGNVPIEETFFGHIILGTIWLLLIPVLAGAGVVKEVRPWFVRAGAFAFISGSFALLGGTFIDSGNWSSLLVQIGIILSWLMAGMGGLVALGTTK